MIAGRKVAHLALPKAPLLVSLCILHGSQVTTSRCSSVFEGMLSPASLWAPAHSVSLSGFICLDLPVVCETTFNFLR